MWIYALYKTSSSSSSSCPIVSCHYIKPFHNFNQAMWAEEADPSVLPESAEKTTGPIHRPSETTLLIGSFINGTDQSSVCFCFVSFLVLKWWHPRGLSDFLRFSFGFFTLCVVVSIATCRTVHQKAILPHLLLNSVNLVNRNFRIPTKTAVKVVDEDYEPRFPWLG